MTEQARIITEEEWKEYKKLKEKIKYADEIFKIIKRNIEERDCWSLDDFKMTVKSQVVGYLERWNVK